MRGWWLLDVYGAKLMHGLNGSLVKARMIRVYVWLMIGQTSGLTSTQEPDLLTNTAIDSN